MYTCSSGPWMECKFQVDLNSLTYLTLLEVSPWIHSCCCYYTPQLDITVSLRLISASGVFCFFCILNNQMFIVEINYLSNVNLYYFLFSIWYMLNKVVGRCIPCCSIVSLFTGHDPTIRHPPGALTKRVPRLYIVYERELTSLYVFIHTYTMNGPTTLKLVCKEYPNFFLDIISLSCLILSSYNSL